jgi:hypothetical protein
LTFFFLLIGKPRRKRRPVPTLKANLRLVDEPPGLENGLTEDNTGEAEASGDVKPEEFPEELKKVEASVTNGHASSCDSNVNGESDEQQKPVGYDTPKKDKASRNVARNRARNGEANAANDAESSPPKMRTRSAKKAEARKITEYFRPAAEPSLENGDSGPEGVACVLPNANRALIFSSPSTAATASSDNEEKENKVGFVGFSHCT